MAVVVIPSNGKGDRSVESLGVKAPGGWQVPVRSVQGGEQAGRPQQRRTKKPRKRAPREADGGMVGSAEPLRSRRRPVSESSYWTHSILELPGVREGGMSGRNWQRKPGTTRGSPRRSRTAKASRISRQSVKSRCAREWGGWG